MKAASHFIALLRVPPLGWIVGGLALACWPAGTWWLARMTDRSDDPLGVAALLAAGFFLWQQRREIAVSNYGVWLAVGLLLTQGVLPLPPLVRAGCLVAALSLALALPRRHSGIMLLLFLSLPVVASLQYFGGYPLRLVAAEISRALLWVLGTSTERVGTLLRWRDCEVGVDAACSGVKMLWSALFIVGIMAARAGFSWRRTVQMLLAATALVIGVNGLRSTILFFPEAKMVSWPEWTHDGIGIGLFVLVAATVVGLCDRVPPGPHVPPAPPRRQLHRATLPAWGGAVVACVILTFVHGFGKGTAPVRADRAEWPTFFEGEKLHPVPLSEAETRFAAGFPGQMNVFTTASGRTIILRRITRATRQLHSSAQCLQAAGYTLQPGPLFKDDLGRGWASASASGPGSVRQVRELIIDDSGRSFPDPSTWFWPALLGQSNGPWTAITVME